MSDDKGSIAIKGTRHIYLRVQYDDRGGIHCNLSVDVDTLTVIPAAVFDVLETLEYLFVAGEPTVQGPRSFGFGANPKTTPSRLELRRDVLDRAKDEMQKAIEQERKNLKGEKTDVV